MKNLFFLLFFLPIANGQKATVPMKDIGDNTFEIGVLLNGMYADCIIDPGVYEFILSPDHLKDMIDKGYASERDVTYDSSYYNELPGPGFDRKIVLKTFTVGDLTLRDVQAYIIEDFGPSCVMGQEILRRFKSYSFDNVDYTFSVEAMSMGGRCTTGDCKDGYGYYIFDNGEEYRGNFINGEYHGFGMFTWANGNFYLGNFVNSMREGSGTYYYNGRAIQGNWVNGKCEGKFVLRMPDGTSSVVMFKDDKLVENGECH